MQAHQIDFQTRAKLLSVGFTLLAPELGSTKGGVFISWFVYLIVAFQLPGLPFFNHTGCNMSVVLALVDVASHV